MRWLAYSYRALYSVCGASKCSGYNEQPRVVLLCLSVKYRPVDVILNCIYRLVMINLEPFIPDMLWKPRLSSWKKDQNIVAIH